MTKFVDFDAVRAGELALYVAATNVFTGELRVSSRADITADAVMASACLPFLFRAVCGRVTGLICTISTSSLAPS